MCRPCPSKPLNPFQDQRQQSAAACSDSGQRSAAGLYRHGGANETRTRWRQRYANAHWPLCGLCRGRSLATPRRGVVTEDGKEKGAHRAPLIYMAGPTRLELATSGVTGLRSNQLNYDPANQGEWWEVGDLNPRPPACKAGALTPELTSQTVDRWERNGRGQSIVCQPCRDRWRAPSTDPTRAAMPSVRLLYNSLPDAIFLGHERPP